MKSTQQLSKIEMSGGYEVERRAIARYMMRISGLRHSQNFFSEDSLKTHNSSTIRGHIAKLIQCRCFERSIPTSGAHR